MNCGRGKRFAAADLVMSPASSSDQYPFEYDRVLG
jgi:hypothetical protein